MSEKTIVVDSRVLWTKTGITVGGNFVRVEVISGQWTANPATGLYGPHGHPHLVAKPGYAGPHMPEGCLLLKYRQKGDVILWYKTGPVDINTTPPTESIYHSELLLACNDDANNQYGSGYKDNQGSLTVKITWQSNPI